MEKPPVGSPLWWLDRLDKELRKRRPRIERWDDYYRGDHPLLFATSKYREAFAALFKAFADNWMQIVVDSVEERLHVEGFRFATGESGSEADEDAWYVWQANGLDRESGLAHLEALICGESYALVDPTVTVGQREVPQVTVEHPSQMICATSPENRRVRSAALKRWRDDDGRDLATVYLPDAVHRFERVRARGWVARSDGDSVIAHGLGVVPVVPFTNRNRLLGEGVGEHANVIPLQDACNKVVADMIVASEFAAFLQRWATGLDVPEDENGDLVKPFDVGLDKLLWSSDPETKFGALPATELRNYVASVEMIVQHIASQSRTPPHYLLGQAGTFPSGEPIALAEPLLTANRGWTTMGDVQVGDLVFAPNGTPVMVSDVHDGHVGRDCMRVTFDDGSAVVADASHRWPVRALPGMTTGVERLPRVATTREIAETLRLPHVGGGRNHDSPGCPRYVIPVAAPLDPPETDVPLDPWTLGYWLGNGGRSGAQLSTHTDDADWVMSRLELAGIKASLRHCTDRRSAVITMSDVRQPLRDLDLLDGEKHIPAVYLTGSFKQRLALLQGVLDADGSPDKVGRATLDLNSERLARDVGELAVSLGQKLRIRTGTAHSSTPDGREYTYRRWRLAWSPSVPAFSMPRKAELQRIWDDGKPLVRYIVDVQSVESVPVRCITVDSPEHTFLIGRSLIPTCNSLRSAETGLIAKVKARQRGFEESWEDVIRLTFAAQADPRADVDDAETAWRDPESRTESEHVDALTKLRALEVPLQQLWEDAGYSPQQISRFRTMSAEDSLRAMLTRPVTAATPPSAGETGGGQLQTTPATSRPEQTLPVS